MVKAELQRWDDGRAVELRSTQLPHEHYVNPTREQRAVRSVVIFSGRWWGIHTPTHWVQSQLRHLIVPNNATVLVSIDIDNICHVTPEMQDALRQSNTSGFERMQRLLSGEVASVFTPWPHVYAQLIAHERRELVERANQIEREYTTALAEMRKWPVKATLHKIWMYHMRRWLLQWEHFARAEEFRRETFGHHDVVVRTRLDAVLTGGNFDLSDVRYQDDSRLHAFMFRAVHNGFGIRPCVADDPPSDNPFFDLCHCSNRIHDFTFIGTPSGIRPLLAFSKQPLEYENASFVRCHGWCAEEQTMLRLRHEGVELVPIRGSIRVQLQRPSTQLFWEATRQQRAKACTLTVGGFGVHNSTWEHPSDEVPAATSPAVSSPTSRERAECILQQTGKARQALLAELPDIERERLGNESDA